MIGLKMVKQLLQPDPDMTSNTIQQGIAQLFIDGFNEFEASLNGEKEHIIHNIRTKAFESFKSNGFPGSKDEEYKYTSITKRLESKIKKLNLNQSGKDRKTFSLPFDLDGDVITFVNGNFKSDKSKLMSPSGSIEILDLKEAVRTHWNILGDHFARYADPEKDAFIAINTALASEGSFIHIKKNAILERPVIIVNFIDPIQGELSVNTRNLVLVDENSQGDLIEITISESDNFSFENRVSEIILKKNASFTYFNVQQEGENNYLIDTTQVYQEDNSRFTSFTITLHGGLIRNNLNISIDAEGCETNLYGVYFLNGKDHVDNHTVVDHRKPHSNSNELYKGVLDGRSTGVFNGKIYVQQDAQKTNAFQSNKNIVLSNKATMNSKPQLEIWADDVKCSHGATTGMIDDEPLFYLQSRGIDRDTARAMLIYAFANDILEKIHIEPLKVFLEEQIQQRLGQEF